ncbi:hypothetical protein BDQ12DRAFT_711793 [Crucibulum laeve]|uniref:Uncharacterized protein n=1 Tax=Crucibulum laeve TaxID=68775 RepID=A0A5C3M735_9AGAR|nr:hypothetical protein BDQ12DRAFT_711793 [Crucibulum laeve]
MNACVIMRVGDRLKWTTDDGGGAVTVGYIDTIRNGQGREWIIRHSARQDRDPMIWRARQVARSPNERSRSKRTRLPDALLHAIRKLKKKYSFEGEALVEIRRDNRVALSEVLFASSDTAPQGRHEHHPPTSHVRCKQDGRRIILAIHFDIHSRISVPQFMIAVLRLKSSALRALEVYVARCREGGDGLEGPSGWWDWRNGGDLKNDEKLTLGRQVRAAATHLETARREFGGSDSGVNANCNWFHSFQKNALNPRLDGLACTHAQGGFIVLQCDLTLLIVEGGVSGELGVAGWGEGTHASRMFTRRLCKWVDALNLELEDKEKSRGGNQII